MVSHIFAYFSQDELQLSDEQVSDCKEVFQLFDKDQDGVLLFSELCQAINTLGQRHSGTYSTSIVRN